MRKSALILIAITLFPATASACIWKNGAEPFWPDNQIEVCFVAQEQGPDYRLYTRNYNEARRNVQRVFEQEINGRTKFEMVGFKTCEGVPASRPLDRSRAKAASAVQESSSNRKPMVRIDFTREGFGAMAATIGPESKSEPINLTMGYLDRIHDKSDGTTTIIPMAGDRQKWTALHELMHLLGFCHEDLWDESSAIVEGKGACTNAIKVGSSSDKDSVMMRGDPDVARLSDQDVRCLEMVATKEILNYGKVRPPAQIQNNESPSEANR